MAAVTPYTAPDYYLLDDLFSEELKMIRGAVRDFNHAKVMPDIEEWAQNCKCPTHLIPGNWSIGYLWALIAKGIRLRPLG